MQERDLDGREIALEHAQLVDAAADGRLLAERVPTASPTNGSNTSAEVNGRIDRVRESRTVRVAAGAPFK